MRVFPILRASGRLGPKRQEGDRQVPEGFYTVDRLNPRSLFHLSLGLDYPNASDRLLATDPLRPGSDIFIHGGAESIGCLALGDAAAAQLFLVAHDVSEGSGQPVAVHIFPCRMEAENWRTLLGPLAAGQPTLERFWRGLQAGFDAFERTKLVPAIRVKTDGGYVAE